MPCYVDRTPKPAQRRSARSRPSGGGTRTRAGWRRSTAASRSRCVRAGRASRCLRELDVAQIDFAHYKSVLKNQDVVAKLEAARRDFKPVDYDLGAQLKAIDAFHEKAVVDAKAAQGKIDVERKALDDALGDIEQARSVDDLTVRQTFSSRTTS